jgi:serine/threonine protein kinase
MDPAAHTPRTHVWLPTPTDFGLSIDLGQERAVTRVGTLDYMAPEVVVCPDKAHPQEHKDNSKLWYDFAVDVWAAGILAYELVCGKAPFDKVNH